MFKTILQPKVETNTTAELTPVGDIQKLRVNVHHGQIIVRQWEQEHVEARVHVEATGQYAEELEKSGTDVCWILKQHGEEVRFEQQEPSVWSRRIGFPFKMGMLCVDVELFVPQGLHARLESHNDKVEVEQFRGNVRAISHNGALSMREIVGDLELETHNGHVDVEQVDGHLAVMTHNGSLELERVSGRVKAETHNGRIKAQECLQQLYLMTHHGEIQAVLTEPLTESWNIETKNGAIKVEIPRETKAMLDVQSKAGKISGEVIPVQSNGLNQQLYFALGGGTTPIRLESKLGSIQVNYAR